MFPEKPKNSPQPRRMNLRGLLIALIILPFPLAVLLKQDEITAQFVDMLLIGVMLCCTLYLGYQGIVWVLATLLHAGSDDGIEQS